MEFKESDTTVRLNNNAVVKQHFSMYSLSSQRIFSHFSSYSLLMTFYHFSILASLYKIIFPLPSNIPKNFLRLFYSEDFMSLLYCLSSKNTYWFFFPFIEEIASPSFIPSRSLLSASHLHFLMQTYVGEGFPCRDL